MSNTILTPTAVTREILRVLHQKLNFVGSIERQYDDSFAKSGAKIGTTLKIRKPNQYTVRTGKTIQAQDTAEESVTLTVATQKGVDMNFSSAELTMELDDFSDRIIKPAVSVLAANIEYDAMSMFKDVGQSIWNGGSALTLAKVLAGKKKLNDSLAPMNDRTASLQTQESVDLVDSLKGLFQSSSNISQQYREGTMGHTAGFEFVENTLWPAFTRGAEDTAYVCNTSTGITSGSTSITVSAGSGAGSQGDVFTIQDVYAVHPETKVSTGVLFQFVAAADFLTGATTIVVYDAPVTSGAKQNVSLVSAGASKDLTFFGTLSTAVTTSLLYQKEAFAFATADLELPRGVHFAAREMIDGLSLRIVRAYDVNNDMFPCRLDILYGYETLRPQLACRLHNN